MECACVNAMIMLVIFVTGEISHRKDKAFNETTLIGWWGGKLMRIELMQD